MALEQAPEGPLGRVASVALRGERFALRVATAAERYGLEATAELLARRAGSAIVRAGTSVICAWHEGMTLPEVRPVLGVEIGEVQGAGLPEVVAVMRQAGWRDAATVVRTRAREGKRCFAARWDGAIVAHLWVSRSPHNPEELWDLRLESDEARTFDWFTLPEARGKRVLPAVLSHALHAVREAGVRHAYTSIGGDNQSSLRAAAQVFPVRREYRYFMVRGMRRPVVPGLAQSTYPTLDPIARDFDRINVTNLVF